MTGLTFFTDACERQQWVEAVQKRLAVEAVK
jgi:hypothetical protein